MSYPVKWYDSSQIGSPTLAGSAGSLIALLDACLVNGFNLRSIEQITFAALVATAKVSAGHGYREGDILLIQGADDPLFNGEHKIRNVTATTFDYDLASIPSRNPAGTLTAKIASLAWEKTYTATNLAAYRASDPAATRLFLRVDDTAARYAIVTGYETMTDASTGSGRFPLSGDIYWEKSNSADTTIRKWTLVGDGRAFYLFAAFHNGYSSGYAGYFFGDINSYKAGDAYHCGLLGNYSQPSSFPGHYNYFNYFSQNNAKVLARSFNQIGGAVAFTQLSLSLTVNYPSPVDNGLLLAPIYVIENNVMRGDMPGLLSPLHPGSTMPDHGAIINDIPDYPGRDFLIAVAMTSTTYSRIVVDLTGPWR